MIGALDGLRVVDLSRVLAGPYCTMTLGDLGADVVKVELPEVGDETRRWGPPFAGDESAYFLAVNRNKRGVTLDIKSEVGREILDRLLARADVLIENFRPGTLDALGFGWDALRERYPRLIYCAISAFGQNGPYRDRPGYDFAIQAIGGLMSITGEPDGEPMKVGVAIVDVTAGLYAATAILAALRARERDGRGQRIDVSLFGAQLAWLINVGSGYLVSGNEPRRFGNAHPNIVPYESFPCVDGHIAIAAGNDAQFRALLGALGADDLAADARFGKNPGRVRNRDELVPRLREYIGRWTRQALLAALDAARVPCAPINTVGEALRSDAAAALGAVIEVDHPTAGVVPMVRWPFDLSVTPASARRPPPTLGGDTDTVLSELGFTAERIAELRAAKVI